MLRILLVVLLLVFPQKTLSQNVSVGLYTDASGSDCAFSDVGGVLQLYVVVTGAPLLSAVEFAAPIPDCMTGATWVGDIRGPMFLTAGDSQDGVEIALTSVLTTPVHVLTISLITSGTSSTCCEYPVLPHPSSNPGRPVSWVNEFGRLMFGEGLVSIVNPGPACSPCGASTSDPSFPFDPIPGSGARTTSTTLRWNATDPQGDALTYDVYFSQDHENQPLVASNISDNFYETGLPNSPGAGYWKIVVRDSNGNESAGPVWEFRVQGTLPVEEQSWGATKWGFSNDNKN